MNEQNELTEESAIANLRSLAYGYLASGFRKPEEENFDLNKEEFLDAWKKLIPCLEGEDQFLPLLEKLKGSLKDQTFGALSTQYEYLFSAHGGIKASLYETDHTKETPQHALSQGHEFGDIAGFFKAFGLEVSKDFPDRVDFIGSELEFMHFMAAKEVYALNQGTAENVQIVQDAQNKFVKDHLGRWTHSLAEALQEVDKCGFYAALTELVHAWVTYDQQSMGPLHFQAEEYQHVKEEAK